MRSEQDARLSALLDGALGPREETALRAEIARDPALAARLAELARVDAALRALPARPVPADLRARLQAKLEAERAEGESPPLRLAAVRGRAPRPPSRRRAWIAGSAAAAAAAAAALLVVVGGQSPRPEAGAELPARLARSENAAVEIDEPGTPNPPIQAPPPAVAASVAPADGAGAASATTADGAAQPVAFADASRPVAGDAPLEASAAGAPAPQLTAADGALASAARPLGPRADDLAAPSIAAAPEGSPLPTPLAAAENPPPALWIEATEDEAAALAGLDPDDASVVAVLDYLDVLEALEAEAS